MAKLKLKRMAKFQYPVIVILQGTFRKGWQILELQTRKMDIKRECAEFVIYKLSHDNQWALLNVT